MKAIESTPKLVEQVTKAILEEISGGKFRPGTRIIQEQIAKELGVSRQPIQQALLLLRNQGTVDGIWASFDGQAYIIDSFMVVVFGGVGNLWGTLVAAMTLGVANKFLEPFAGAVLAKILILGFIILFIQKRPRGLFALKGRAVEA